MLKHSLLTLLGTLMIHTGALAVELPVPAPGFFVNTRVLYDCPEGPGWMRITAVNSYGQKNIRTIFVGSRKDCQAQAVDLRKKRSLIPFSMLIAVCSASPHYLVRWQINEWAQIVSLPHEYYKNKEECLSDAAQLNN